MPHFVPVKTTSRHMQPIYSGDTPAPAPKTVTSYVNLELVRLITTVEGGAILHFDGGHTVQVDEMPSLGLSAGEGGA